MSRRRRASHAGRRVPCRTRATRNRHGRGRPETRMARGGPERVVVRSRTGGGRQRRGRRPGVGVAGLPARLLHLRGGPRDPVPRDLRRQRRRPAGPSRASGDLGPATAGRMAGPGSPCRRWELPRDRRSALHPVLDRRQPPIAAREVRSSSPRNRPPPRGREGATNRRGARTRTLRLQAEHRAIACTHPVHPCVE